MKQSKFSEEEVIEILGKAKSGEKIASLCLQYGISDATFYKWRSKFGDMDTANIKKIRQLEKENACLKKKVQTQAQDIFVLKDILSKKF